jgi:hypothetical protein
MKMTLLKSAAAAGALLALLGFLAPVTAFAYGTCPGSTTEAALEAANPGIPVYQLSSYGTTAINVNPGADAATLWPWGMFCDLTNNIGYINGVAGALDQTFTSPANFSPMYQTSGGFARYTGDTLAFIFSSSPSGGQGDNTGFLFFMVDKNGNIEPTSTPPVVTSVRLTSDNASSTLAKMGNVITLTFSSDSDVQTPDVRIGTHVASVATTTGNNFTASTALDSSDNEGAVTFSLRLTNDFGNMGFITSTTTDGSSVNFDKTAPVLAEAAPIASSTNPTPLYSFTTSEAGAITYGGACSSATNTASVPTTTVTFGALPAGTYSDCTITVTDAAGNVSAPLLVSTFTITSSTPSLPPPPKDKDECKEGGWRRFTLFRFKNQGDCVSSIVAHKYKDDDKNQGGDNEGHY